MTDKFIIIKLIVFCILKANINNLKNNLRIISLFRHKTTINSEEDYFLLLIFQAIEFIEKMNYTNLKIKKNEYYEYIDEYEKKEMLKNVKEGKSKLFNYF